MGKRHDNFKPLPDPNNRRGVSFTGQLGGKYDKTRQLKLNKVSYEEGWRIVVCPSCENGKRRQKAKCVLCKKTGLIRALDPNAKDTD